eukprot:Phypoly_transcript_16354.p1 GENE.Phypoly_transcript_16354~~Phypoly_transcript_16354.p1  ORF type:complete len:114 (+),score=26.74 Phypoly_transcript_16354:405-746(+)
MPPYLVSATVIFSTFVSYPFLISSNFSFAFFDSGVEHTLSCALSPHISFFSSSSLSSSLSSPLSPLLPFFLSLPSSLSPLFSPSLDICQCKVPSLYSLQGIWWSGCIFGDTVT